MQTLLDGVKSQKEILIETFCAMATDFKTSLSHYDGELLEGYTRYFSIF